MVKGDFHMHSTFCDGKNTPEEMVNTAIQKGMTSLGICVHSYQFFDESFCIKKEKQKGFLELMASLKEKYKDKIKLYAGVELEYFSEFDTSGFDYIIGSVHYVKYDDNYLVVDSSRIHIDEATEKYFGGDIYAYCEAYYELVGDVCNKTNCNIIGHIDLVTKFNEGDVHFDTKNPRYINADRKAVDKLVKYNVPFEMNTGAISRGYRTSPYPSDDILEYILSKGGKIVLSSDAHNCDSIGLEFDKCEENLKKYGVINPEFSI